MKAFEIQNSFGLDALNLIERPDPSPGYGQVLIKLRVVSLNYRDLMVVKGLYNRNIPLPLIPFSDGVGEVVALGNASNASKSRRSRSGDIFSKVVKWQTYRRKNAIGIRWGN